ncbi:sigma-70 family RNA polymerase sigma factor [Plantactinospora sp. S1510]|uniref:Sigma-70 family RNA polymerase sigma factor n=1 Tax=Plantactinospora alkalitolerans TaxID=2789879 RepID=A0ABS0GYV9_9ACTN|nr:sigma-70 family RNA polymerase sigma factor [Plantactinospora alkalitolerans]MBF9131387.1 sigma-70 family RNA polymerase sigma factor [Plantactinospora alkalitolerans]
MRGELVLRAVSVLVEDAERLDVLSWDHVIGILDRRGLEPEEVSAVVAELARLGIPVERGDDGGSADHDAKWRSLPALPAQMGRHRILAAEEEAALGRRIQLGFAAMERRQAGAGATSVATLIEDGLRARDELVRSNLRLVISIAQRLVQNAGDMEFEDLLQEGVLGLQRAAEKFDPTLGYKFSTYATWWVRQAIGRGIDRDGFAIRLPAHVWERLRKVNRYTRSFELRNGRSPVLREVAEGVEMDVADLQALLDISRPLVRLDAPIGDETGGGTLGELLANGSLPAPEDAVADDHVPQQLRKILQRSFDPRSIDIIERRFGLSADEPATLDEIGRIYGVSRERVRQIELKLLMTLSGDDAIQALAHQLGLRPQPKSPAARYAAGATSHRRAPGTVAASSQENR